MYPLQNHAIYSLKWTICALLRDPIMEKVLIGFDINIVISESIGAVGQLNININSFFGFTLCLW